MGQKKSFKTAVFLYLIIAVSFVLGVVGISKGNRFNYEHREASAISGYEPSPEINRYHISTSLAWEATNAGSPMVFKVIGYFLLAALGIFIFLASTSVIIFNKASVNTFLFVGCVIIAACLFGAYGSLYTNNWLDVSVDQNKAIQDSKDVLVELFKSKELIK